MEPTPLKPKFSPLAIAALLVGLWHTGFMLMGELVEFGTTDHIFTNPADPRTQAYLTGRFG